MEKLSNISNPNYYHAFLWRYKNIKISTFQKSMYVIPGVPKITLHFFKSLLFDVKWSKHYKILRGCSGIIL